MNLYGEMPGRPRRELHVFYVLDTSGSMRGIPIAKLNQGMRESLVELKNVAQSNGDARVKVSVLEFNSTVRWLQPNGPEDLEDFLWENLTAGGLTSFGAAITELNSKLSKEGFLRSSTGLYMPILIFMTDGYANDDYAEAVKQANQNPLFKGAVKIGLAVGDDADFNMIERVTGSSDAVIRTTDLDQFIKLLVFVTESASTMSIMPDSRALGLTGDEECIGISERVVSDAKRSVGLLDSDGHASAGNVISSSSTASRPQSIPSWELPNY